jgi:signal transduction histidine kinase
MILHLNTMLDDILTVGRVETGGLQFNPIPHNLTSTCEGVLSDIMHSYRNPKEIFFENTFGPDLVMVDEKLLRHILINLLSNAQKYSHGDHPIYLNLSNKPDRIIIQVKDRGIGIPEEDQHRIFDAFHRGNNVMNISGTGLGLTIVKKSVELHGGEISFTSKPGAGTVFTVTLPLELCTSANAVA